MTGLNFTHTNSYRIQIKAWLRLCLAGILFIIMNIIPVKGQANRLRFDHITVEDGLSQSWVRCIYQDKYDFIWIGTDDGLNLYDGDHFKVYKNNPRDKNTISSSSIQAIFEDSKGNLWIGTSNGLDLYDRQKDCFFYQLDIVRKAVISIDEDKDYNLWIGTAEYLYRYNPITKNVLFYSENSLSADSISDNYVNKVFIDSEDNIWVGTNRGLNLFNRSKGSFIKYLHDPDNPQSLSSDWIYSLIEDHQKRLWVGTSDGLNLFKNDSDYSHDGVFVRYMHVNQIESSIIHGGVLTLLEDKNNNLWIGIENGGLSILDLKNFDEKNAHFLNYYHDPQDRYSLNNNSVQNIFLDKQDIIWIGTFGNGISKLHKANAAFLHFINEPQNFNSISDNHVNAFLEDGDYIWIGTEGGLNRYNKNNGLFKHFTHDPLNTSTISSNAIWAIYKDSRENLWVGTWAGGLNLFNYGIETFSHYYYDPDDSTSLGSNNVFSIREDSEKKLWIGTMGGGLNEYNYDDGSFKRYHINNSDINSNYVEAIAEDEKGILWLANVRSLERFNTNTLTFEHFLQIDGDTNSLSGNKVFSIYRDSNQKLWVGTDAGLNLFDESTESFTCYRIEDGLPDNSVKSIVEDMHGNLWIGTNKGLSKFVNAVHPEKGLAFKNFTPKGGLQGYEFERRSCMRDKEGKMYFGGVNGFNIFHPDSIKDNPFIPNIVITEFLLFNKAVEVGAPNSPLKQSIFQTKELTLTYKQSVFSFKFRALNYEYPEKNQYAYKMEGFNSEWIQSGNNGEATFTNLDPGTYIFRVMGSNNDGVWNKVGTSIKINIRPPWWQTWWFRIIAGLVVAMSILSFFYWRVYELRKQKKQLQQKVIERTKEIEGKNLILQKRTNELNETNILLEERQEYIEEQAEELKAQADELMDANKNLITLNATKDKFFSIIAHDLKNPFTSILGFCEVLFTRYDKYDDNKRKHLIGVINQSAQSIYKLLENLLQWAKSQTGNIKFNPEEFDFDEIVTNNLVMMENQMFEKHILAEKNLPSGLKVFADKNMLNTVLRNLLSNAIKFSESGKIIVRSEEDHRFVTIYVTDSGIGMTPEEAKSIFEIGIVKSTEGTRGEPGTGLGLLICKDFIERHGGKIGVESEVNKGSTFYFTIPNMGD